MEGFKTFTGRGKTSPDDIEVTILRGGRAISFNTATYKEMGYPEKVELSYNYDKKIIGIRPVDRQTRPSSPVKRMLISNRYYISTGAFTRESGFNTSVARCYPTVFHKDRLVVALEGPSTDIKPRTAQ